MHVLAAALGLSLLIAQSALAYSIVKYLGAAYLIYLGIRILASRAQPAALPTIQRAGARKAFRDGVIVEALNVKTAMFFLAFIPQFVTAGHGFALQFIVLGTTCVALNTAVDLLAVSAASRFVASGTVRPPGNDCCRGCPASPCCRSGSWLPWPIGSADAAGPLSGCFRSGVEAVRWCVQ